MYVCIYICMCVCMYVYVRIYVCMYVCMVITYSRVWISRVRLPTLLLVSSTGKTDISLSPFAPENLVSRDGFGRPVQSRVNPLILHTEAESSIINHQSSIINMVLTQGIPPGFRGDVHLFIPPTVIGSVSPYYTVTLLHYYSITVLQ